MTTRFYNYPLSISVLLKAMAWSMVLLLLATTFLLIGVVSYQLVQLRYGFVELVTVLPHIFGPYCGSLMALLVIHSFSNIGINEHGLQVQFMWRYITVPWTEIIAVEERSFGLGAMRCMRVKARRISWLHYFYGITCPAVKIYSSIDNYGELVREIRSHISKTRAE